MKRLISLLFIALLGTIAAAQVSKTINVATVGTLGSLLTGTEKTTVTNLTITGILDARDFVTMHVMTVLAVVDISTVYIAAYTGTDGTAGSSSQTYPAKELPVSSFYYNNTLKTITLPTSVTSIGTDAFAYCTELTSVTIPSSVTSIGDRAFEDCSRLTSVTIPSSVTSIGDWAFQSCFGLTSVTIPSSVTSIGDRAFRYCSGLTSVMISSSVISIGSYTFEGCSGLTSVTIPSSVTSIGSSAFSHCTGLTSVTIPASVISIESSAFSSCTGLTSVTIPASLTSIGSFAFEGCRVLTSVTIPSSVTSIGLYAFKGCSGLITVDTGNLNYSSQDGVLYNKTKKLLIQCPTSKGGSFIIPSSVTSIGTYAFYNCTGLTSVSIPSSVTSIGDFAFSNCTMLTSIIAYRPTPVDLGPYWGVFGNVSKTNCILYVPTGRKSAYEAAVQWGDFWNILEYVLTVSTKPITSITLSSATLNGSIDLITDTPVTAYGFCWNTTGSPPTIADTKMDKGVTSTLGVYSSNISGLSQKTTYYVRAYAIDGERTVYGSEVAFTTPSIPDAAGVISGATTVCQGQNTVTYTVPTIAYVTSYIWTLPTGATGTSTTNSIIVNYAKTAISGNITVKGHNEWGDGVASAIAIIVKPLPISPLITRNGNVLHSDVPIGNQWYNQNGLLNGATLQNYTVTANGDYYAIVTLLGCSSEPSNTIKVELTGIENVDNAQTIKVYPNPVSNELIIEIEGNNKKVNFEILNSIGQVVFKENLLDKTIVQTTNFAPGVYLVRFENGKTFEFKKIIKE